MLAPNPNYGTGIFRRRVRLRVAAREANIDLEDSNHALRLVLHHDGERITAIVPDFVRHPFTTCPESKNYLATIVGRPLYGKPDRRRALETRVSCTHVMDMIGFALANVHEDGLERLYDIAVEDERDGRMHARITCNGQAVHAWVVVRHAIVEPDDVAGGPMMQGFHAWARETFTSMAHEAALALQRGYFVAQARRFDTTPERQHRAIDDGMSDGVCYSYSTPTVRRAERIDGSKRDFTNDADALLHFECCERNPAVHSSRPARSAPTPGVCARELD